MEIVAINISKVHDATHLLQKEVVKGCANKDYPYIQKAFENFALEVADAIDGQLEN